MVLKEKSVIYFFFVHKNISFGLNVFRQITFSFFPFNRLKAK